MDKIHLGAFKMRENEDGHEHGNIILESMKMYMTRTLKIRNNEDDVTFTFRTRDNEDGRGIYFQD